MDAPNEYGAQARRLPARGYPRIAIKMG